MDDLNNGFMGTILIILLGISLILFSKSERLIKILVRIVGIIGSTKAMGLSQWFTKPYINNLAIWIIRIFGIFFIIFGLTILILNY